MFVRRMLPSTETAPAPLNAAASTGPAVRTKSATAARISGAVLRSSTPVMRQPPSAFAASARRVRVPPTSPTRIIPASVRPCARRARPEARR